MKLNPMFRPPADFVKSKPHRKLYIPTDDYPGYNFIGKNRWCIRYTRISRLYCMASWAERDTTPQA